MIQILLVPLVFLMCACSTNKSSVDLPPEVKLQKAQKYFEKGRYSRVLELAEELSKSGVGAVALEADLLKARTFKEQEKFLECAQVFETLARKYPLEPRRREWLFQSAFCLVSSRKRSVTDLTPVERAKDLLIEIKRTFGPLSDDEMELWFSILEQIKKFFSSVINHYSSEGNFLSADFYRELLKKYLESMNEST